jgi:hypothetical protein
MGAEVRRFLKKRRRRPEKVFQGQKKAKPDKNKKKTSLVAGYLNTRYCGDQRNPTQNEVLHARLSAYDGSGCDLGNGDQPEHLAEACRPEANAPHCADRHGAADQARRFRDMAKPARGNSNAKLTLKSRRFGGRGNT